LANNSRMPDALRSSADDALRAWATRVRANREQVEQFREASPADFYAPVAAMFRSDPHRRDDPTLDALRALVQPADLVLDIGAGGGRFALPLANVARGVIAIDASEGMLRVLRESMAEHAIDNIEVVSGRWPAVAGNLGEVVSGRWPAVAGNVSADVALMSHIGYDVEDIGPFLDAMESAARRLCVAVLVAHPPPTEADKFWPAIHGVDRAALPSLPEFLALLLARDRLFEVRLVDRQPQTYDHPDQLLIWLRQQLWTQPESPKDQLLQRTLAERLIHRDGKYALNWNPVPVGVVTWH
jgi:SAM-dependent methyltransferase